MHRAIPVSNKIIEKRIIERSQDKHQKKLQELKPIAPDDQPSTVRQFRRNKKKEVLEEERFTEIERCNRILLERLSNIMKKNNQNTPNDQNKFRVRSLNRDSRKRELVKITIENQNILKRIQNQKSGFSIQNWEESRRKEEIYLQNISEFPIKLYSTHTSRLAGPAEDDIDPSSTFRELTVRLLVAHNNLQNICILCMIGSKTKNTANE